MAAPLPKVAIFLHDGGYDRVHQGLSIAAAAAAAGRPVEVFFFWWALERLVKDDLDQPTFTPPREDLEDVFERRQAPTLRQLLAFLKETGHCRTYACSGSLGLVAQDPSVIASRVDQLVGWSTILQLTAGVTDRFYL